MPLKRTNHILSPETSLSHSQGLFSLIRTSISCPAASSPYQHFSFSASNIEHTSHLFIVFAWSHRGTASS